MWRSSFCLWQVWDLSFYVSLCSKNRYFILYEQWQTEWVQTQIIANVNVFFQRYKLIFSPINIDLNLMLLINYVIKSFTRKFFKFSSHSYSSLFNNITTIICQFTQTVLTKNTSNFYCLQSFEYFRNNKWFFSSFLFHWCE
jgi:hypothetical protein